MRKILIIVAMITSVFLLSACNKEEGQYNEGVYYAIDQQSKTTVHVTVDSSGMISNVLFDRYYENTTLNTLGDEFVLESGHTWEEEANFLSSFITLNQGWGGITLVVDDITGMNTLNVPDSFISIDYTNSPDNIAFFTTEVDGFALAWNEAISEASDNGTGVLVNVPNSSLWLEANMPPFVYRDGVYYADDKAHGYFIRIVIKNGFITDVVFDAITAVNTRVVWHDNFTPDNPDDDIPHVEIISMTTKMSLYEQLTVLSGAKWYTIADKMTAAIVDKQTWDPNWLYYKEGTHEYFDMTDPTTIDGVGGVTIAIEGFRQTYEDAITKAIIE